MNPQFSYKEFIRTALAIALPIALQNFIYNSLNMVDNIMVGQLGTAEVAAVGQANKFFFFYILISFGACSGCGIFISQYFGKNDPLNIKRVLGITLLFTMILSFVFALVALFMPELVMSVLTDDLTVINMGSSYLKIISWTFFLNAIGMSYTFALRNIHKTVMPMVISAIAVGINTFLNYLLIFGHAGFPKLGIEGAAIATLIARFIEAILVLVYVYRVVPLLAASFKELIDWNMAYLKNVYNTVWPVVINEGFWSLGIVFYAAAIARIDTDSLAAYQIADTIYGLYIVLFFGIGNACSVMIGTKLGSGERELAFRYAKEFSIWTPILGLLTGVALYFSTPLILQFYTSLNSTVIELAAAIILVHSIMMAIRMFNVIMVVGILRAGGDTKFSMFLEMGSIWLIGVPLTFFGAIIFKIPVYWVVVLISSEEIIKAIIAFVRLKSKKWMKDVTITA